MLRIDFADILRATLPIRSGNEGWIGVSPTGDYYHIVVPVDRQIARGVMAGNLPTDGTPFGGYSGWLYYRCAPFDDDDQAGEAIEERRREQARTTGAALVTWLASYDVEAEISNAGPFSRRSENLPSNVPGQADRKQLNRAGESEPTAGIRECPACAKCGKSWDTISSLIRDPEVRMDRYRACMEDFRKGTYVFSHACGGSVEVPVTRLGRPLHRGRSLAGTHACPGFCRYEKVGRACSAVCEGSVYLRIARKLVTDRTDCGP